MALTACFAWVAPAPPTAAQECAAEVEPNDMPEAALAVEAPGCLTGALESEEDLADHFLWTVDPDEAAQRWTTSLSTPGGMPAVLTVTSVGPDPATVTVGTVIASIRADEADAPVQTPDLLLVPGRYLISVTPGAPWSGAPTSYQIDIQPGTPLPPSGDREPNDDPATANAVDTSFELSGDTAGSNDHFAWQVGEPTGPGLWTVEAQGAIGAAVTLTLLDAEGVSIGDAFPEADGIARLPDLRLAAGAYTIRVTGPVDQTAPYVLRATQDDSTGADPEPNDDAARALPLEPGRLIAGRLARTGDIDSYRLSVDEALGAVLLDARLIVRAGPPRRLCLLRLPAAGAADPTPRELSCDDGQDVASLPGLLLAPAEYLLAVSGASGPEVPYYLRVDTTVAPVAGFETEPNDTPDLATAMTPDASLSGRLDDPDHVRVHIDGEPQLWQVEARGEDVRLLWERTDGVGLGTGTDPDGSGGRSVLTDVYLIPGDHWFRLDGTGEYTLSLVPLGPPVPGGELEPNDELSVAEALPMDGSMTGRIGTAADSDIFRFSLSTTEHVGIRLEPPPGASLWLYPDGDTAATVPSPERPTPGEATELDLVLPAGDHAVRIVGAPTQERYRISLTRLDPYATPGDQEPPLAALPLEMDLVGATPEVAAFESLGQQVSADLVVTNTGAQPLDLALDATTSEPDWTVDFDETELSLGPGASAEVPVTIDVPAQAWGDSPVRTTVRARAGAQQATTFVEVTPRADAPLVAPFRWWSVADELLGGLDAASIGLGAVPLVAVDPVAEGALHDGVIALGGGMDLLVQPPLTLSMDLAGDDAAPVAGMLLDPSAGPGVIAGTPMDFELALSEDGVTYQTVLTGRLSGALAEQAFVLPAPVPARYAQLRVDSVHPGSDHIRLGEWKVVASPGWQPGTEPLDLAEPARGGHVAWVDPQPSSLTSLELMLDEDVALPDWLVYDPERTTHVAWVLGFQDGRAAQVTELQWQVPTASDPTIRLKRLQVAGSMEGPLGPWTPLGTWDLEPDASGAVAPFTLEAPVWARYIRMSGPVPKRTGVAVELPGGLRVLERPASEDYRSVVGEWGSGSAAGPYEWQQPVETDGSTDPAVDDEDGRARDAPLEPGSAVQGRVARGDEPDSYRLTVPEGQQTARIAVSGRPSVGVGLRLIDESGAEVPMTFAPGRLPGTVDHEALVVPGRAYRLLVEQPPFSVVVAYDSSASIGAYVPIMAAALRSYTRGIVPGAEAIRLLDLEADPFPEEFSDDPWLIQSELAAHAGSQTGSSSVEIGLIDALDALAAREGTRAIFLSTDAETASYLHNTELWRWLELFRPRIFATHVGGSTAPSRHQALMQDWAASGGGYYEYVRSAGTMERAFDRMATWLRRPADYGLVLEFAEEPPPPLEPGRLSVISDPDAPADPADAGEPGTGSTGPAPSNVAIELVLDTSGSMRERLGRQRRIDVAKEVLARLVTEQLPPGTPVALRTFRPEPRSCDSDLVVPLGPLDPAAMGATVDALEAVKTVQTPLAAAIAAVADDLAGVDGPRVVVVVSDGRETCGGDPEAAVQALIDQGFDVSVNVVGLGLDRKSRREVARLAEVGQGTYYDARDAGELAKALKRATGAPYVVLDADGAEVGRGTVDGPPIELPPGSYRVTIIGAASSLGVITIESGDQETLTVG